MAVTTLTGLVDDQDILQNERVIDMDPVIAMLDPDNSQFTTMLMKTARRQCFSTKVEWLEDQLMPRLSAVVSGGASDGATITVTAGEGAYFRAGDIVRNSKTGVAFRVTSVATDTLTIGNHLGAVAFAAHSATDQLVIIGNSAAQGATLGTEKQTKRVAQFNYTQIQRNPYGFTNSITASKLYGGPVPDKERSKKAVEHKRAIEYTLFWGARDLNTGGSEPIGASGGLFEFITSYVKNAAGTLTHTLLDTYLRDMLQHTASASAVFVSPLVAQAISGFLKNAWTPTSTGDRLFGAKVDGYISGAYGTQVPVFVKRDWNDFASTNGQYGGWAFVVNMQNVELNTLRNTELLRDRQAPDADRQDEEYLSEFTLKVKIEKSHGLITGVTG